jgi:hypothetical protein
MAEFHLHGQIIKRSQGRSAVNAAAYRAGEALYDKRLDRTFDYTGKHDVEESIILGPDHAPGWMFDRQMLWNTVEDAERHKRAQLAREFDIALPIEFVDKDPAAAKEALKGWAGDMFVTQGLMVDINFHNMGGKNPHAHVMTTMRRVHSQAMEFQEESRYAFEDTKARDQNDWGYMDHWRETWADYANAAMADHGIDARIDHRTLIEQDIDRELGIHLGPVANAMEARGEPTGRWLKNEMIWFDNEAPWFEENRRYVAFLDSEAAEERQRLKEEAVRQEAERKENEAAAAVVARADELADLKRRLDQAPEGILGDHAIRFYNVAERVEAEARAMAARRAPGLYSLAERLHAARPSTQVAKERLAGAAKPLNQGIKRVLASRADRLELAPQTSSAPVPRSRSRSEGGAAVLPRPLKMSVRRRIRLQRPYLERARARQRVGRKG